MSEPSSLRKNAIGALRNLYDLSSDLTENASSDPSSKKVIAAAALSTLLQSGLNKVSSTGSAAGHYATEANGGHFTDRLIEKVLNTAISPKDRKPLEDKLKDKHRVKKPRLSVRTLFSNFKNLSARLDIIFKLQYGIVHVFQWEKPTLTLTVLVLYTLACLYPYLYLIYPAIFLLGNYMIPSYLERHPLVRPKITETKRRGRHSLGFLEPEQRSLEGQEPDSATSTTFSDSDGEENLTAAVVMGMTSESDNEQPQPIPLDPKVVDVPDSAGSSDSKTVKRVDLLINMRDLQNLTGDLIKGIDSAEEFFNGQAGFSDEIESTLLFFKVLAYVTVVFFLGPFIPWKIIFIVLAWIVLLLRLPKAQKLVKIYKERQEGQANNDHKARDYTKKHTDSIIIDEPSEKQEVEVFEIEQRNLSNQYEPFCFSTSCFDASTTERMHNWKPDGVPMIEEVLPPAGWKFDSSQEWQVDEDSETWCRERYLKLECHGEWAYDIEKDFRRRRMYRKALKMDKPPLHPLHK